MLITNYIKTAIRNLWKHKGYSLINLSGLAIGMACCILIMFWVGNELSFDRFHQNADRIYRLGMEADLGGSFRAPVTNGPAGPAMEELYPEVLKAVRITGPEDVPVRYKERQFQEEDVTYADEGFFDIFTFPLLAGDPKTALKTAYSVVITESMVSKYFQDDDPMNKIITINGTDYTVTGITRDFPKNSHISFNMICSFATLAILNPPRVEEWMSFSMGTYLLLAEHVDPAALEAKLPELIDANLGPILNAIGGKLSFWIQPLTRIHLYSDMTIDVETNGKIALVYLFSGIALMILFMAGFNFINLATARSALRIKEVGVRKTVGATRKQLILQFLSEAVILSLLAIVVTVFLLVMTLDKFNAISGYDLTINYLNNWWILPAMLVMALITGLLSGSYPAFYLSAFQPSRILSNSLISGTTKSRLRRILVVFQFTVTIVLLIGTVTISNQLHYINNKPLGFNKEQIMVIPEVDRPNIPPIQLLKDELKNVPGVLAVTTSSRVPGSGVHKSVFLPEGFAEDEAQTMDVMSIDADYLPMMGIDLATGRNFSAQLITDTSDAVLINQTAAQKFGWQDPIGKKFFFNTMPDDEEEPYTMTVVGVIHDFHLASLHEKIDPIFINNNPSDLRYISLKISATNTSGTLEKLQQKWHDLVPTMPFDYLFLDDRLIEQYQEEEEFRNLTSYFSLLAVFIGCLGLFGMSSFTATKRTKEIGIRKVLGASVTGIVRLLSTETIVLILVASVLAYPIAWYAMNYWLDSFVYRADFNWGIPALVSILTLIFALATISYQSLRVALTNPVESLRYE